MKLQRLYRKQFEQQQKFDGVDMHRYELVQEIGHGAYSIVFKAINITNNTIVAIKRINHTNNDISIVLNREIQTLKALQHPNIIKLYEVFNDATYAYLVFQYLPYDLIAYYKEIRKTHNRNLKDQEITYIAWQVCQALGYMHQCGLMHRDIKPENVLVDPSTLTIKLIDFGFATRINPYSQHTQYMITRWYRPLQIVLSLPYDAKSDIFALGALIMELYRGEQIFRSSSNIDQLYWVLDICGYPTTWPQAIIKMSQLGIKFNSKKQPEIYKMVSKIRPEGANLILGMLQTSPFSRISANQMLRHPYFAVYLEQNARKSYRQVLSNHVGNQNAKYGHKIRMDNVNYAPIYQQNNYMTPTRSKGNIELNLNLATVDGLRKKINNSQLSTERLRSSKNIENYNAPLSHRQNSQPKQQQPSKLTKVQKQKIKQQPYKTDFQKHFKIIMNKQPVVRYKTQGQDDIRTQKYALTPSNSHQAQNHIVPTYMRRTKQEQQIKQQIKGLKNRTKSYQGISVVSLKRNHSNGAIVGLNPQTPNNYFSNYVVTAHDGQRKQATFTKIRDKLVHQTRPVERLKISLTDRNLIHNERRNVSYQVA